MRSLIRANQLDQDVFSEAVRQSVLYVVDLIQPVTLTGNQSITGLKSFITPPQVSGADLVVCTGNQIIGGLKTFSDLFIGVNSVWPARSLGPAINVPTIVLCAGATPAVATGRLVNQNSTKIDWINNILSGNWFINATPTNNLHIVNKDYVDNGISNVVRLTGNQTQISGIKTFRDGLLVVVNSGIGTAFQVYNPSGDLILANSLGFKLRSTQGFESVDVDGRFLRDSGGALAVNYGTSTRGLSGNWLTNTIVTQGRHIINKNYLDNNPNFVSGLSINDNTIFHPLIQDGYSIYNAINDNVINTLTGYLGDIFTQSLNWSFKQLSGLWTAQQFKISDSGSAISYFTSGRANLTTGLATINFPQLTNNVNILYNSQLNSGTVGFLNITNRQNGIGFSIQSSSTGHSGIVYWEAKL